MQTRTAPSYAEHCVDQLYRAGVSLGINTDARTITNVTLEQEYARLRDHFAWTDEQLAACNREALRAAFIDDATRNRLFEVSRNPTARPRKSSNRISPYTDAWCTGAPTASATESTRMVERRIKPHQQQLAEDQRRAEQRRLFRRNQIFGLLIIAAAILVWWLFHTNPKWIFPPGWWRP